MSKLEKLVEELSTLTVLEASELSKMLEEKWGVSAAAPAAAMMAMPAAAAVEEKTEFDVVLTVVGENKVGAIKVVRDLTGLGLKEAKDLVDGAPSVIKAAVGKTEAEDMKKKFQEIGATVELK